MVKIKYVLILLMLFRLRGIIETVGSLFTSKEDRLNELNAAVLNMKLESGYSDELARLVGIVLVYTRFIISVGFYVMSAFYVNDLAFTLLASVVILKVLRESMGLLTWFSDMSFRGLRGLVTPNVYHLAVVVHYFVLAYFIIITW